MELNLSGPFLKQHKIDQLHSEDALQYKNEQIHLHPASFRPEAPARVNIVTTLAKTVLLPPFSTSTCGASLKGIDAEGNQVITEGNEKHISKAGFPPQAKNGRAASCEGVRRGACDTAGGAALH